MDDFFDSGGVVIFIIAAIVISLLFSYAVATSDLPDWVKLWILLG